MDDEESPFAQRHDTPISLTPGQRIKIAGRVGTFCHYLKIDSFPNSIEWLPDGTLAYEINIWGCHGTIVSEWDDSDSLSSFEYWEGTWNE